VGYVFCCCFLFFNDFFQPNYFNIYQTGICQICKVGRTMAVGDQSEIGLSIPSSAAMLATFWLCHCQRIQSFYKNAPYKFIVIFNEMQIISVPC